MLRKRIAPVLLVAVMALASACGKGADDKAQEMEEVTLQPLEERKMTPEEEAEISVPEPDSVGNMMVYPSGYDETGALYGTNTLTFYFENEGVVGGGGYVYVYESPSGAAFDSVSTSSSNVTVSPMDEAGTLYTGWESGSKIDVCFPETFESGKNYYVLLDPSAFRLNEHLSKSITNASLITFRVKEYGFEPFATEIENGSSIDANIKLGGDVNLATCEVIAVSKEGMFTDLSTVSGEGTSPFETVRITEDGTFSPDLTGCEDSAVAMRLSYFTTDGKAADSSTFVVTVGNPTAEDLVSIRSHIYGDGTAAEESFAEAEEGADLHDGTENLAEDTDGSSSVVISEPLEISPQGVSETTADSISSTEGLSSDDSAKAAGSDVNFKEASVSETIHKRVDSVLEGRESLSSDEKGALIVDTLNALAKEGFVREGTPFYDSNSGCILYTDANGKKERTKL